MRGENVIFFPPISRILRDVARLQVKWYFTKRVHEMHFKVVITNVMGSLLVAIMDMRKCVYPIPVIKNISGCQ